MSTDNSSITKPCVLEITEAFRQRFGESVRFNEPLAPYLTYRVGGPADILVFPRNKDDLVWLSNASKKSDLPITMIGTGTNLLVVDEGIRGITVSLLHAFQEIELAQDQMTNGTALVRCGGGVPKARLLGWAIERGLTGLEFSSGVPGTIGGGIYMNAGTKYGCYADILKELTLFDFHRGFLNLKRDEAYFGYREQSAVKDSVVTSVLFELRSGNPMAIRSEVNRIIAERAEKQPLDYPSCGSTFKNPEGHSAGRLIERAGLKGLAVGGAEVSSKHANFILNKGKATASDILTLIDLVRRRVEEHSSISLECEVIVLGARNERQVSNPP